MIKNNSKVSLEDISHDGTLESFAERNGLKIELLRNKEGVIILPQNRYFADFKDDLNLFPQVTKNLFITFKEAELQTWIYDDKRYARELILESVDVVLPILLFIGSSAVSVGLNILSNWIYDNYIKTGSKQSAKIRIEYAELNEKGVICKWKRIEAPSSDIFSILKQESLEKTSKEIPEIKSTDNSENSKSIIEKPIEIDWWKDYCRQQASLASSTAGELIVESKKMLKNNEISAGETISRRSLQKLREAYLWEPESHKYRILLHRTGKIVHNLFGCILEFKDGSYWVTCPVMLSHSRGGFSIGGYGKTICSICGEELLLCPHDKYKRYNNISAKRIDNICNICCKSECDHKEGKLYDNVQSFGVVIEMNLDHVSFVENPSNPLCVVQSYSVSEKELMQFLPEDERKYFVSGKTVIRCHHCTICDGS